ncbi:histidyl-tRNA synthetase [Ferroglobus placidus DSM 10642]|uniref:Histidine--tRNA ligase n=1 Tax=Ferroglobus placidus (strain DSM 10642 / AEDII12DO) TaxID=589924 RepID=D3S0N1_FERPA|nr:histidine--tRNA ligase [Ferroglobus placidus]ADC66272.1 histidyl-tRNA synthetase [Ferroglobus placidus DSM 10642]
MKIERPRGTRDFLPEEMEKRRELEKIFREVVELFGYREVQTPTFEHLELFTIKSGEEIIKEIYAFKDKGGRDLALRPELTAPVMRMFVNECSHLPKPLRFYYFSNCFRYERPQKGRYREFWQFGAELIGSNSPEAEAEVILLSYRMLEKAGVSFELSIGDVNLLRYVLRDIPEKEAAMRLIDKEEFETLRNLLAKYDREEIYETILQLGEIESVEEAEEVVDYDFSHLKKLCEILDALELKYFVDFTVARGLDYYTGTVFEYYAEGLGAQKQICGGGSYRLAKLFGGEDVPGTGFAIGFDRVMELFTKSPKYEPPVVVVSLVESKDAFKIAERLRENGVKVVVDVMGRNLKKQMSFANDISAEYAVIIGKKELESGTFSIKDLVTGKQKSLSFEEAVELIKSKRRIDEE